MTHPTPMSAYTSVTTTRVMPPAPPTKPAAYATRLAQHIAMGKTPAQAMKAIEREDGHFGKLPIKLETSACGGRGRNRSKHPEPLSVRIMENLTAEWAYIDDDLASAIGSNRENIYQVLRRLRDQGIVEQSKITGQNKFIWRLKA